MQMFHRLFLIALLLGLASCATGQQTPQAPKPKSLTTADLQKLRWIEGSWRGTGVNQPAFFERYRFESDSILAVDSFDDEKLTKVTDTTRFELKDSEFGGGSEGSRYVATAIDDNSITFEPVLKARNSFTGRGNRNRDRGCCAKPRRDDGTEGQVTFIFEGIEKTYLLLEGTKEF